MVYGCGCVVVGKPSYFTTSAKMGFFWLPLLTMNYSREPFTHIWEWKRRFSSSGYLGSSFWIFMVAMVVLGSALIICFPLSFPYQVLTQSWNMHLILKPLAWPPVTASPDTHLCCESISYGTHTTFLCPFSASQRYYFLPALAGCLGSPCLGFVLCSMVWGHLSLAYINHSSSQCRNL